MSRKKASIFSTLAASTMVFFSSASQAQNANADLGSQQRIDMLQDVLKKTKTGQDALDTLAGANIKTVLTTPQKLLADTPCTGIIIAGRSFGRNLLLNSELSDMDLAVTITHESRHTWQLRKAGASIARMDTPERAVLLSLFREADAFAYEIYFTYQYEKATGKTVIKVPEDAASLRRLSAYDKVYALFKINLDTGMEMEAAYRSLLRDALEFAKDQGYDGKEIEMMEENARTKSTSAPKPAPISDAAFASLLRKLGTIGTDPDLDKNAFTGQTDAEIIGFVKSKALSDTSLERLKNLEAGIIPPRPAVKPSCGS